MTATKKKRASARASSTKQDAAPGKLQVAAIPQLEGLYFAHGLRPAFAPMAQFADYLTGRSNEEPPDCEGLALSGDTVLGRAVYGETTFSLCMHLCGRWHIVTHIRAFDPGVAALRAKMTTTTPQHKRREEERLAHERQRQEEISEATGEAAQRRTARERLEREREAHEWGGIQATNLGNALRSSFGKGYRT